MKDLFGWDDKCTREQPTPAAPLKPAGFRRRRSPTLPRYQQIVAALRKEIEDNTLKAGDMLPSEAELRDRSSVSRHTIREALRALRDEGFVESRAARCGHACHQV